MLRLSVLSSEEAGSGAEPGPDGQLDGEGGFLRVAVLDRPALLPAPPARSFSQLSLTSFTLLASGSTSAFTVAIPNRVIVGPVYTGITSTSYNKGSELSIALKDY